jgi:hypothetical protein
LDTEASYGRFWATRAARAARKGRKRKSYFRLTTGSIAPGLIISSTLLATADEGSNNLGHFRCWQILLQKSAVTDDVVRPVHFGAMGFAPDPDALYATFTLRNT